MSETDSYLDFVRVFTHALPSAYKSRYDAFAIADHARVVFERGERALHAGPFRSSDETGTTICVVAENREVLRATLSRATVVTRLDVIDGEAYTFETGFGPKSVMGLFTVRPRGAVRPLLRAELKLFFDVLAALGSGIRCPPLRQRGTPGLRDDGSTHVRFREGMDGNLSALEVETDLRSGLVRHLIEILLAERFEIVECEVKSTGQRVFDRFRLVERSGASVSPSRWRDLQTRVFEAISRAPGVERPSAEVAVSA